MRKLWWKLQDITVVEWAIIAMIAFVVGTTIYSLMMPHVPVRVWVKQTPTNAELMWAVIIIIIWCGRK